MNAFELCWASDDERHRRLPGDKRVPHPKWTITHAITVNAPPEAVWPWIVQMGEPPRAGYYSYTWIERLQGLEIENVDEILPEFQTLKVGGDDGVVGTVWLVEGINYRGTCPVARPLMVSFFGATKLLPIAFDLVVRWAAITKWLSVPTT